MKNIKIERIKNIQIKDELKSIEGIVDYLKSFCNKNVELQDDEMINIRKRAEYIHQIIGGDFDLFITLTFKDEMLDHLYDEVALKIRKLIDLLSAEIYGKRSKKRIKHYTAIERRPTDGSLHAHIVIEDPKLLDDNGQPYIIGRLIHYYWIKLTGTVLDLSEFRKKKNKEWVKRVYENGIFGLAEYMTKDCYRHKDTIISDLCCLNGRKPKVPKQKK